MFFEFSAETLPYVLQADCVGVFSEVRSVSFGSRPSHGDIVLEFDHEGVDKGGASQSFVMGFKVAYDFSI